MKLISNKFFAPIIICITVVVIVSSCKKKESNIVKPLSTLYDNVTISSKNLPVYPNGWVTHNKNTPAPQEGIGSPFDTNSTTNGIFHQWAWQKFLWLTKPTSDTEVLHIKDKNQIKPLKINVKVPLFLNSDSIIQVDSNMKKAPQQSLTTVVLKEINQAGSPQGILKTNPNYNFNNVSNTIYYSLHVNSIFFSNAVNFLNNLNNGTLPKDNLKTFPVGSLELKVSWVAVDAIPKTSRLNFYTTIAAISSDNGKTYEKTEVALLGMHIVGVVENHPEFIWATFEHNDLAPNYNWHTNTVSTTNQKLLFSTGSTTGLDGITYNKGMKLADKAYNLFKYNVPVDATGFMKTSQSEPINFNNMTFINNDAASNLKGVWQNYFYNGALWLNTDGLSPEQQAKTIVSLNNKIRDATPGSLARGSVNNANVTMETFTQTFQTNISSIKSGNLANCFSCHSAISYNSNTSPIYLSHIFDSYINNQQGKTIKEVEQLKLKQEIMQNAMFQKKIN